MEPGHRDAFDSELAAARSHCARSDYDAAFARLERAHVLGQRYVLPHMRVHWMMLVVELRRRDPVAAWGQLVRVILGTIGSALGRVPTGNTGGTNISMFKRLPIDPELERLMGPP